MNLSLKSKTTELIQEKVASGRYASAEEVIEEAIQLLEAWDREGEKIMKELEG